MILQRTTKVLRHLAVKFDFQASWNISPLPPLPNNVGFLFLRQHRLQHLHNIELGAGGIRKLTLNANKIEHLLQYQKVPFSKSVSTSFVTHYSFLFCIFFSRIVILREGREITVCKTLENRILQPSVSTLLSSIVA